jgi:hypothetical protein
MPTVSTWLPSKTQPTTGRSTHSRPRTTIPNPKTATALVSVASYAGRVCERDGRNYRTNHRFSSFFHDTPIDVLGYHRPANAHGKRRCCDRRYTRDTDGPLRPRVVIHLQARRGVMRLWRGNSPLLDFGLEYQRALRERGMSTS